MSSSSAACACVIIIGFVSISHSLARCPCHVVAFVVSFPNFNWLSDQMSAFQSPNLLLSVVAKSRLDF